MSDTEQQTKTANEDVPMDDVPATTEQGAAPVADEAPVEDSAAMDTEEPAAAEEETNENTEKPTSSEKPVSSKSKNRAPASARKEGNSSRKLAGKIAKSDAKESSKGKFKVGDVVLGKLKGYPAWPAVVVDGDKFLPENVRREKPRSSTIVCIQYFPSSEYSWLSPSDVKPLPKHEIDAYLKSGGNKKTTGDLYLSYEIAAHPKEWIAERDEERAVVQEQERIAALKAAEKAKKGKEAAEDEDELADEDEEDEPAAKSGGKRKRIDATKKISKEPASKRAKADKAPAKKSAKSKDTAEEAAPVSKKAANSKAAANSKKAPASTGKKGAPTSAAKDTKESKEDADDDAMSKDPEAVRVRDWRHKLQRAFLSKSVPSAEEMDTYDRLFTTIENYQNMTVAYLAHSKIGKVMKKIAALPNIPKNDELKITDRAHALMQKWTDQIDNGKPAEAVGNGDVDANGKGEETAEVSKEEPANDEPSKDESAKEDAAKENAAEGKMDIDNEKKDETTAEDSADKEGAPVLA